MRKALKVAKWEIKRNLKNKTFLISLFLMPAIILGSGLIGGLLSDSDDKTTDVFIQDDLDIESKMKAAADQADLNWNIETTDVNEGNVQEQLDDHDHTAYLFVDDRALEDGTIPVYTSDDIDSSFMDQLQVLANPIKTMQMQEAGLSQEELAAVSMNMQFEQTTAEELEEAGSNASESSLLGENLLERFIPGAFAAIILFSIIISGMYIFQSASNEKKDKIAEIILSSITPGELMQGKIMGYFVLGMIQAGVFLLFIIPMAVWNLDIPILDYLFTPELILMVAIAILGYFLFAAMFIGLGATMSDMSASGNYQGFIMLLPMLPLFLLGPILNNPSGLIAQIGTFVPFTTPGVLIIRLITLEDWPWMQIIIALGVLVFSIWVFMKLAGKIFKTGILMYGKNASIKEIWKWLRA